MLDTTLKISLVIFMFGNMLDLGLRLDLSKALQGLRDVRFVILTLVWGYIVYPALGYLLAKASSLFQVGEREGRSRCSLPTLR
jgi:BASS family bile acid:Na+ symporter